MYLRNGNGDVDGSSDTTNKARRSALYPHPDHISFTERTYKLTALVVKSFGYLEKPTVNSSTSAFNRRCRTTTVCMIHTISITTQVAVFRRMQQYFMALGV